MEVRDGKTFTTINDVPAGRINVDKLMESFEQAGLSRRCRITMAPGVCDGEFETDNAGLVASLLAAHDPDEPTDEQVANAQLRSAILSVAQSAVGVTLNDLTAAQRNALIAVLFYKAGGVGRDLKVRPLAEWDI